MAVVHNVGRWSSGSVSVFKQGEFLSLPEREPRRSRGVLRIALGPHFSNPPAAAAANHRGIQRSFLCTAHS
jgi:hypothetical protein